MIYESENEILFDMSHRSTLKKEKNKTRTKANNKRCHARNRRNYKSNQINK